MSDWIQRLLRDAGLREDLPTEPATDAMSPTRTWGRSLNELAGGAASPVASYAAVPRSVPPPQNEDVSIMASKLIDQPGDGVMLDQKDGRGRFGVVRATMRDASTKQVEARIASIEDWRDGGNPFQIGDASIR